MAEYTQTYWNELIDKYRNGTISADERYQLEKQALDDPFLFDALEGFSLYEKEGEVGESENRKTKIFTLPRMAVAASLIILVAFMFNIYSSAENQSEGKEDAIAMVLEPEEETEGTIENATTASSAEPVRKEADLGNTSAKKNVPPKPKDEKESLKRKSPTKNENIDSPAVIESKSSKDDIKEYRDESTVASIENTLKKKEGEVTADMPPAAEESTTKEMYEVVELSDFAIIDVKDNNSDSQNILILSDSATNADGSRQEKSKASRLSYFEAVPVIGKKIFDEYAKERIDKRGLRQPKPQEVTIEFTIDKNGNLTDFHHIYSGCPECGPFAISILQNSGEWKTVPPGFSGKARYTFMF